MYKDIIDWIDIFLVPAYLILFLLILIFIKKRNPDNLLIQKYLIKGFVFKVACALFHAFLIYYYYGFGDNLTYFKDAIYLKQQISAGVQSLPAFIVDDFKSVTERHGVLAGGGPSGLTVEKVSVLLSYISFSRYLIVTLFFAMIAYSGIFKMLQTFCDIMPEWHKRVALVVLFFPTISVFGAGILKDSLCIAALGWLIFCAQQLFFKRKFKIRYVIMLILAAVTISIIKIYILAAFIVPYILYLLILLVKKINNRFVRRIVFPALLLIVTGFYIMFSEEIDNTLGYYAVDKLLDNVKEQQSAYLIGDEAEAGGVFDLGSFDPTISGFIAKMPAGIVATLYRPFLWESKKLIMVFSALESFALLWFTLYVPYKTGLRRFFRGLVDNPFTFLCITYALLFAALIGLSTFNFGTLARYRIPLIPFYAVGLMNILYNYQKAILKKPLKNTPE